MNGRKITVLVSNNYVVSDWWKAEVIDNSIEYSFSIVILIDYPEAVVQAPFGIDPNYIQVMNKDQQEMVERAVKYESRRHRSPESAMQEEENRWVFTRWSSSD